MIRTLLLLFWLLKASTRGAADELQCLPEVSGQDSPLEPGSCRRPTREAALPVLLQTRSWRTRRSAELQAQTLQEKVSIGLSGIHNISHHTATALLALAQRRATRAVLTAVIPAVLFAFGMWLFTFCWLAAWKSAPARPNPAVLPAAATRSKPERGPAFPTPSRNQGSPVAKGSSPVSPPPKPPYPRPTCWPPAPVTTAAEPLCPDLVVPAGSECLLVVPSLLKVPPQSSLDCKVVDVHGKPLLKVALSRVESTVTSSRPSEQFLRERLVLHGWQTGQGLGSAEVLLPAWPASRSHSRCAILMPDGSRYAELQEEPLLRQLAPGGSAASAGAPKSHENQAFILSGARQPSWQIFLRGVVGERCLGITDAFGRLVGTVEPAQGLHFQPGGVEYYCLRLAPEADAGLVLMAVLSIDRLLSRS